MSGYHDYEGEEDVSNEDIWSKMCGVVTAIDATDDYLTIATDRGEWCWRPEGDCCTHAYIHEPETVNEEAAAFVGAEIVSAECSMEESIDNGGDVRDIHFYKLNTTKGTLVITLYADHNGYYGGWLQYEA